MTVVSDDFNRANSTNLGANWAEDSGDFEINTNTLRQGTSGGSYRKCRWVGTAMQTNDYTSNVDGRSSAFTQGFGAFGRGVASATVTYYAAIGFGGDSFYIVEITAGGETILDTGSACTANTTYNVRLQCNGSNLEGFVNTVSDMTVTDSSLTTGSVGCMAYADLSGANDFIDAWGAADLNPPGGGLALPPSSHPRTNALLRR